MRRCSRRPAVRSSITSSSWASSSAAAAATSRWSTRGNHVFGFTVINDLSARDLQRQEMSVGLGPAKGKDFATAVGPWIVTRDSVRECVVDERLSLAMRACVNDRELSRGNVAALHHSIPRLIAHASRDAELFPGDLLGTGTVAPAASSNSARRIPAAG